MNEFSSFDELSTNIDLPTEFVSTAKENKKLRNIIGGGIMILLAVAIGNYIYNEYKKKQYEQK